MKIIYTECLGYNNLEYYAFCSKNSQSGVQTYGVCVKDCISHTENSINDLTCSKQKAIDFVESLIRNTVHPEFLREIAEDYLLA